MSEAEPSNLITRAEIAAQLTARLAGRLSNAALAAWAFDRFYAFELEETTLEPGAEDVIEAALDTLMFGDDPSFQLSEPDVQALLDQLNRSKK
jgi:hypothetical protein